MVPMFPRVVVVEMEKRGEEGVVVEDGGEGGRGVDVGSERLPGCSENPPAIANHKRETVT